MRRNTLIKYLLSGGENMKMSDRLTVVFCVLLIFGPLLFSCSKPKEGKVVVADQEFTIHQDNPHAFVIDAKGKVKNVGDVDVKNIVVTAYCRSCGDALAPGRWMASGEEKTADQKDVINYLAIGQEAEFHVKGVAFIYALVAEEPKEKPQKMEVVVESFETVK
jgi:hypothetical protein